MSAEMNPPSPQQTNELLQRILNAVEPARPRHGFEIACAVVLALATTASAWCAYQSKLWGGAQMARANAAVRASREGAVNSLAAAKPGIICVELRCYGFSGPWAERGGFEQHGQCVTGFSVNEGSPECPINPPTYLLNDVMAGIGASIGMFEALRRRAREGGSYLVRASLARNCCWVQDFGLFPESRVRGAGLPEHMMTAPGLQARIRPEFDPPLVTSTGPLGEVSVLPPQVECSEFRLGPRFSGEPNGASKLDWSVFTQEKKPGNG